MTNISITSYSAICNLGSNINEILKNALEGNSGCFTKDDTKIKGKSFFFGEVKTSLPEISQEDYNTRTNRLLLHCCEQIKPELHRIIEKYGKDRIGVVIGTTDTGVEEFQKSKNIKHTEISNPAEFLHKHLELESYYCGVSTACTSGTKAFSTAVNLLQNGVCDAVIAGSTDGLSKTPIFGFHSLEVLSFDISNPFSKNRDGINIGEGAALFILEKDTKDGFKILAIGETSDAYHSATPAPEGIEASRAIEQALEKANLKPEDIDYINMHGTGTVSNDIMEANAIYRIFKDKTPCSTTKSLTGHCLGASAGVETAICLAVMDKNLNPEGYLPPHVFDGQYDEQLPLIRLVKKHSTDRETHGSIKNVMCNSFGFGGSNAVIIIGR